MQINSTEAAGLLAFVPTAVLTALASSPRARQSDAVRADWRMTSTAYALFTVELVVGLRERLHAGVANWLQSSGLYPERHEPQLLGLLIIVVSAAFVMRHIVARAPTPRMALVRGITGTLIGLFLVEAVSLHAVDAVFYRPVGPVMLIAWLWLSLAWGTAAMALDTLVTGPLQGR